MARRWDELLAFQLRLTSLSARFSNLDFRTCILVLVLVLDLVLGLARARARLVLRAACPGQGVELSEV